MYSVNDGHVYKYSDEAQGTKGLFVDDYEQSEFSDWWDDYREKQN